MDLAKTLNDQNWSNLLNLSEEISTAYENCKSQLEKTQTPRFFQQIPTISNDNFESERCKQVFLDAVTALENSVKQIADFDFSLENAKYLGHFIRDSIRY